jgi:hypothetical protein
MPERLTKEQRDGLLVAIASALYALADKLDDPEHFRVRRDLRAALAAAGAKPNA